MPSAPTPPWRPRPAPQTSSTEGLREQLVELYRARAPRAPEAELRAAADTTLRADPDHGTSFYFPWRDATARVLPPDEFRELRGDRNRYKLTHDEQRRLREKRVGVVGLSVGQAIAHTLAMEGVGGELRLADPDELSLSNLNRLRASVLDLGLPKVVIAARAIAEIDPYLDLVVLDEKITADNVDRFLDGLDLLIEECDDLRMKLELRERARARGIPVIMHTSERGMLDVERYDLDRAYPLLHGLTGGVDAEGLAKMPLTARLPFMMRVLGEPSVRTKVTLPEVGATVASWPQLASEVVIGGGVVTDVARRILLGEAIPSGRWFLDLGELLHADRRAPLPPEEPVAISEEARRPRVLPSPADPVDYVLAAAILAPSPHNSQPWRFSVDGLRITCDLAPERFESWVDHRKAAAWGALGAARANLEIAATGCGHRAEVVETETGWVATLAPADVPPDPLLDAIPRRVTNRQDVHGEIDPATLDALRAEGRGHLLLSRPDAALGEVIGKTMRELMVEPRAHHEFIVPMRWTPAEVETLRDGLDVASLEMDVGARVALGLLKDPAVGRTLREVGGGMRIGDGMARAVAAAPAVGLVVHPEDTPHGWMAAGAIMERIWLRATLLGLAVYPIANMPFLWARYTTIGGLDAGTDAVLEAARPVWLRHFPVPAGAHEGLFFRLGYAPPPSAIALRRAWDAR